MFYDTRLSERVASPTELNGPAIQRPCGLVNSSELHNSTSAQASIY